MADHDLDHERLTTLMAQAAGGSRTAPISLYQEFGLFIARALRRHLRDLGVRDVDPDDLHGLTMDACFLLSERAGSWRPDGGALPWVWAERRLRMLASRHVGQWSDPLDGSHAQVAAPELLGPALDDPDELELLHQVAERLPAAARYATALTSAATSERNQRVLLAYRLQASLGDRSPAVTIGRRFDMTPAAVRQVVKRTTDRLHEAWQPDDVRHIPSPVAPAQVAA
jgi:hypothetical protein